MNVVCLDLEGVLVPEIWQAVAAKTGVEGLRRTTRDEPDYDVLMRYRLGLLEAHDIRLPAIQDVIGEMEPLEGARELVQWLTSNTRLIILSDTFAQFARPLMAQLGYPTLFCHDLLVEPDGRISGYQLRQADQKRHAVEALRGLNFKVLAAGDSYNDLSMLLAADAGILFRPSQHFAQEQSQLPVAQCHKELKELLEACW